MRHEESPHLDRHKDLRRDACKKCRQVLVKVCFNIHEAWAKIYDL